MAFWGDYHTHTVYSHGSGTVEDNVAAARERGLKAVAITDHGISGFPENMHPCDLPAFFADVKRARDLYPDMTVLAGVEANLLDAGGTLDMPDGAEDMLDLIICGYHRARFPDTLGSLFGFWLPNALAPKSSARRRAKNTDAYIRAMQRYRVGIIAHPLREITCDLNALGEAAKEYGVYIELNSKKCLLTREDFETLAATGCSFICDSDAHSPGRVGDFSAAEQLDAAGLDRTLIANWNAFPHFRDKI